MYINATLGAGCKSQDVCSVQKIQKGCSELAEQQLDC